MRVASLQYIEGFRGDVGTGGGIILRDDEFTEEQRNSFEATRCYCVIQAQQHLISESY